MGNEISVPAIDTVQVTIDSDGLHAAAVQTGDSGPCTAEAVKDALMLAGVVRGIKEDALPLVGEQPGRRVIVAEGSAPVPGQPGWIEILVPQETGTSTEGDDHTRTTIQIRNVRRGEPVARVHEPGHGEDGATVKGEVIGARSGPPAVVRPTAGVVADKDDPGLFVATRDGNAVVTSDGHIDVQESIEIKGNLDLTMGNVTFVGSLVIRGDIHGDMVVKVGNKLTVLGDVDDAIIEAGGDVTIKNGFMGRGHGKIVAGGSVSVQHVRNQKIVSNNDVRIERECINGLIAAKRSILAPRAVIAGGFLEADELVEVGELGRLDGGQVKVRVGRRGRIVERLAGIEKEMRQGEKNFADVKAAVYKLVRLKIDSGSLAPEREQMLTRLQETQRSLPKLLESLEAEKTSLSEELQKVGDAKLLVRGTISDNVFIEVNGARKLTDAVVTGVVFLERNGELTATGL